MNTSSSLSIYRLDSQAMRYLVFDQSKNEVVIRRMPGAPDKTIPVPTRSESRVRAIRGEGPIYDAVYHGVIYPARHADDRRKGITGKRYKLLPPDPWLVALGMVMWEGIVQGLAWDAVKLMVRRTLDKLRGAKIAPPITRQRKTGSISLGFHYTEYTGENKQKEMFIGLRGRYEKEARIASRRAKSRGKGGSA